MIPNDTAGAVQKEEPTGKTMKASLGEKKYADVSKYAFDQNIKL